MTSHSTAPQRLPSPSAVPRGHRGAHALAAGVFHLAGVALTGVAVTWLATDWQTLHTLSTLGVSTELQPELWRHALYSVFVWSLIAGTVAVIKRRDMSRPIRVLRVARGQVMLETLIVITPFLLLTGGLSQLIVNNIAGMLSHLSAYEAGRTYWVWAQEVDRADLSGSVSSDMPCKQARLAAAASLAPVAGGPDAANPIEVVALARMMSSHFSNTPAGAPGPMPTAKSYADAFDTSPFAKRAGQKLFAAYANTDVSCSPPGSAGTLTVEVTYHHFLSFPWFTYIFDSGVKPGYSTYVRAYELPLQAPPQ